MIRAIAAIDDKRGLAKQGGIPWRIPEDSAYWKQQSASGATVMGRTTYEAFDKPLPGRPNIVVSGSLDAVKPGFELVHDLDDFLRTADGDVWIIGGAGLYETALSYCDELYLTLVEGDFDCDRFFPAYEQAFDVAQQSAVKTHEQFKYCFTIWRTIKNR